MSSSLADLTNIEKANQDYLTGLELLQTSCIRCRCTPNYLDAIPYFKKAADIYHGCGKFEKEVATRQKLVRCFNNEKSFWEEGNEYEKISKVQLNQLKSIQDAHNSIINSFNAYIINHSYEDGIKALTKASNDFIDTGNNEEAIKILDQAFDGIEKYFHILTLDCDYTHLYIYECIDKYIDLLFGEEEYDKSEEVSRKSAELIIKDNKGEKRAICKYYGFQAIAELLGKHEDKFSKTVETGMSYEEGEDNFCSKINRFVDIVKQNHKDNERPLKKIFKEISMKVPSSISKMLNIKYIQQYSNNSRDDREKKTDSEEEDLK